MIGKIYYIVSINTFWLLSMSKRKQSYVRRNVNDVKYEIIVDDFLIYETLTYRKIV